MADVTIPGLTLLTSIDRGADLFEVSDTSDSGNSKRTTVNSMLDLTSHPVGIDDIQTLTQKTLTAPTISSPVLSGTVTGTYTLGGTPTFPSSVATLTGSQTLTNKVLTSPTINSPTITNPTITVDAISEFTSSNGVTIDGLSIKDSKVGANGVNATSIESAAVTPEKLFAGTGTTWPWLSWVPTLTNITLGNGTVTAVYRQTGKTVNFLFRFVMGNTSSMGTNPAFSLPVTASSSFNSASQPLGIAMFEDTGSTNYIGVCYLLTTTTATVVNQSVGVTYSFEASVTSTAPMTWTTGDGIKVTGSFEAA